MNNILYLGRGGLNASRYWVYKQMQQETHQEIWTDPRGYYFCNVLCVSSVVRGMGVGKRLMEAVMDQADEEEMPCYLESSKGYPNVLIYEKMGFELAKEIECCEGGDVCRVSYSEVTCVLHSLTEYIAVLHGSAGEIQDLIFRVSGSSNDLNVFTSMF